MTDSAGITSLSRTSAIIATDPSKTEVTSTVVIWLAAGAGVLAGLTLSPFLLYAVAPRLAAWDMAREERGLDRQEIKETRETLLKVAGGLVLLLGALATILTLRYTAEQLSIARDEEVTDRYARAVELIASSNPETRVGGIYALERIMHDSSDDQPTIAEFDSGSFENANFSGARLGGAVRP